MHLDVSTLGPNWDPDTWDGYIWDADEMGDEWGDGYKPHPIEIWHPIPGQLGQNTNTFCG